MNRSTIHPFPGANPGASAPAAAPTQRSARPLTPAEIAYLRDTLEPVRNEVELRKLRAEQYRLRLEANPPLPVWELIGLLLVAAFLGFVLAAQL
jgi:hypothetical protein